MRILYLANNRVGWQVLQWLVQGGEEIAGLVIHPPGRDRYADELRNVSGLRNEQIRYGSDLEQPVTLKWLEEIAPDVVVSVFFGYLLRPAFLDRVNGRAINLHPSLLPFNRGANPNIWSIVEGTPAGATLHYIDRGVDTGDILAQRRVDVEPVDTGESLYGKLEDACVDLFQEAWPLFKAGQLNGMPQRQNGSTHHFARDTETIDRIDLDQHYPAGKLIDIMRARTFGSYKGAYFMSNGRRVNVRISLEYDEEES